MPDFTSQSAPLDPQGFRDAAPTVSKLRFYSIGIVAANKPLNSKEVEVLPTEELPMMDGYLDDNLDSYNAQGTDASGKSYSTKLKMGNSIKAQWLPFCDSQRLTAPDVRRGESVMIYQFGDADKYYWTTLKNDNKLRKLETVIWAFSGTTKEGDGITPETSYFFEVSTHKKLVTFHTSQANGEPYGYDIQINTAEGRILITDTAGNKFTMNSPATQLRMENAVGSFLDITKQIATLSTGEEINLTTKAFKVSSDTTQINASSSTQITTKSMGVSSQSGAWKSAGAITVDAPSFNLP